MPWIVCAVAVCAAAPVIGEPCDADALRGPTVPDEVRHSIVQRGMTGRTFKAVRGRPEIAVAEELVSDEETLERIATIGLARRLQVAGWFARRPGEMLAIQRLMKEGELRIARERIAAVWETHEPGRPRDPLFLVVSRVLPEELRGPYRDVLNGYWDAWLDDAMSGNPERAMDPKARRLRLHNLVVVAVEIEIRELWWKELQPYHAILERLAEAEARSPADHAEAAKILTEHWRETRLGASPEHVAALERRIDVVLGD